MIKLSGFEPDKDIPIVYIGIRPGEKLFEELLTAQEHAQATSSNKIFIAKLAPAEGGKLARELEQLEEETQSNNSKDAIKELLKGMVPNS
jgi:FlaA1/EpsC-like NDP-sugar epimerase